MSPGDLPSIGTNKGGFKTIHWLADYCSFSSLLWSCSFIYSLFSYSFAAEPSLGVWIDSSLATWFQIKMCLTFFR